MIPSTASLFLVAMTFIGRAAAFLSKAGPRVQCLQNGRRTLSYHAQPSLVLGMADGDSPFEDQDDFPSIIPPGMSNGGLSPPDKSKFYSDDELWDILQLHQGLTEQREQTKSESESILLPGESTPEAGVPSLHDLVMQTVSKMNEEEKEESESESTEDDSELQKRVEQIIAIATDVDGTLLSSTQTLHPRTERAIRNAVEQVESSDSSNLQFFFPATGKTRKGALDSLGPEIRELLSNLPGVFIQGLYCVDADGSVVFEQKLTAEAIEKAEVLGETAGVTLLAYDGDNLYSNPSGDPALVAEIHEKWGEPRPDVIPSLSDHSNGFHKILFVHQNADMLTSDVRPDLQSLADTNDASVTQAIPTMLELLPEGCSKAMGVQKLCQALGIEDPGRQLLAIGDAENDVGMLELAAIGVAVQNACGMAKDSADFVMPETNDEGGAGAAMEKFSPLSGR